MKKQLWIWPIIAVMLLSAIGWLVSSAIERTMTENLHSELQTLFGVERAMLEAWLKTQESSAETLANDKQIRAAAADILTAAQSLVLDDVQPVAAAAPAASAAPQTRLAQELGPGMTSHQFVNYFVADKQRRIVATNNPNLLGQTARGREACSNRIAQSGSLRSRRICRSRSVDCSAKRGRSELLR